MQVVWKTLARIQPCYAVLLVAKKTTDTNSPTGLPRLHGASMPKLFPAILAFCLGLVVCNLLEQLRTRKLTPPPRPAAASRAVASPHPAPVVAHGHWQDTVYDASFRLGLPAAAAGRTTVRVSSLYGMNLATARNLCIRPDRSKSFLLYADTPEPGFVRRRSGFTYGWRFDVRRETVPSDATRVPGTTLVISPAYTHHVTHFAESTIPLWHAFRHPEVYPVHASADRIFLKQSEFSTELQWNQRVLKFLAHHAGNASIVDSSHFRGRSMVCFDKAGLVGMGLHEFGFFANEAEALDFKQRIMAFHHAQPQHHTSVQHKSRCLVLQRRRSRRLENRDAVLRAIEETGLYDCTSWSAYTHGEMEDMPFEAQLAVVASTQFLVALHGSGLVNSIFLPLHSAAVDLLPHDYLELEWHNFASKAGVRFFFMFLGDTRCRNPCTGHIFETSKTKCRAVMRCDHRLVDFKTLQVIAAQADFHVRTSPNIRHMNADVVWSAGAARNDTPLLDPLPLRGR